MICAHQMQLVHFNSSWNNWCRDRQEAGGGGVQSVPNVGHWRQTVVLT